MDMQFHSASPQDWAWDGYSKHDASWNMQTETHLTVTAKSMTEYGPLTGFLELRAQSNNADASNNVVSGTDVPSPGYVALSAGTTRYAYLDSAYLELGMLLVGRTGSIYHYFGGGLFGNGDYDAGDQGTDQVRLTWAMSGFGLQLAIEDPRDRWGTSLKTSYSMPDIVGAVTFSGGNWDAKLSGGYGETAAGTGFGAQIGATLKLDSIAPGDTLTLQGAWAQSEVALFGSGGGTVASGGSVWSALVGFTHFWAANLKSSFDFEYSSQSGATTGNGHAWEAGGNLVWAPVTGFSAGVEADYKKAAGAAGAWTGKIRLVRSW
jgi:hypothetical protein